VRRRIFLVVQLAFAAAVLGFAAGTIADQWKKAQSAGFGFRPNWALVALSAVVVFGTYALLIETWRLMVQGWGFRLERREAARIWLVSNLGRYIPGKVWQIGAMGVMAQRAGVSPVAATGSAIVIQLVNLVAGIGVVALTGAGLLQEAALVVGAAVLLGIAILLAPRLLPSLLRVAERAIGKRLPALTLPERPIWFAAIASVAAWLLYGVAFRVFAEGVAPTASGPAASYIAAFTASYLIGYVTLFAPGGVVVRELALVAFLERLHLVSGGEGMLIAVASRLWLTVTEVLPGALYLALGSRVNGRTVDGRG